MRTLIARKMAKQKTFYEIKILGASSQVSQAVAGVAMIGAGAISPRNAAAQNNHLSGNNAFY